MAKKEAKEEPSKPLSISSSKIVAQFQRSEATAPIKLRLMSVCCGQIPSTTHNVILAHTSPTANYPPHPLTLMFPTLSKSDFITMPTRH